MRTIKSRRIMGGTDYKARLGLLKSGLPRIILRRSNKYFTGQYVKSENAKDKVIVGVNSKELLKYGWNKEKIGSLKSKSAGYLTGFLLGKKILDRDLGKQVIFDIGLRRSIVKSRTYAFAKGILDAGIKMNVKKEALPETSKFSSNINFDGHQEFEKSRIPEIKEEINIKKEIEKEFIWLFTNNEEYRK